MNFPNPIHSFKNSKYYLIGLWHLKTLKYSEAIAVLQKGLTHAQKNRFPVYEFTKYLGMAYCRDKQYQKGKEYLLEADRLRTLKSKQWMDSELFYYLGVIYEIEEDLIKAKEYYQLAINNFKKVDEFTDIDNISLRLIKMDKA